MNLREASVLAAIACGAAMAGAAESGQAARDTAPAQHRAQTPVATTTSRATPSDQGSRRDWKWWQDPRRTSELALSAEQAKRLDAIYQQQAGELRSFGEDFDRETSVLNQLTRARTATPEGYRAQVTKCTALMARLREARAVMDYQMSLELNPDQFKKLLASRERK